MVRPVTHRKGDHIFRSFLAHLLRTFGQLLFVILIKLVFGVLIEEAGEPLDEFSLHNFDTHLLLRAWDSLQQLHREVERRRFEAIEIAQALVVEQCAIRERSALCEIKPLLFKGVIGVHDQPLPE